MNVKLTNNHHQQQHKDRIEVTTCQCLLLCCYETVEYLLLSLIGTPLIEEFF
jgi:hypothetical protein